MAVKISQSPMNLRALMAKVVSLKPAPSCETFWFSGDGSTTDFTLPAGWVPKQVHVSGGLQRPGSAEDYTVNNDGFKRTVSFAVAPGSVDVAIFAELSQ